MSGTVWGVRKGIGNPVTGSFIITIPKELVVSKNLGATDKIMFKTNARGQIFLEILKDNGAKP